tara:strand:+ start:14 stop:667 length:654 start_codon:yes stop_codon:yes gene_type:complete
MKKLTVAILAIMLGSFSIASAELGVNVGISGQMGVFHAEAEESIGVERKGDDTGVGIFGYTSVFIEKTLGQYITVGIDYVPESMESETVENTQSVNDSDAKADKTNTAKVDFEDMTTYYVALNLTENFYVKAGMIEVDLITKETLETGGSYGNGSLDGEMMGLGYNKDFTRGIFLRAEGTYMDFDNIKLNSTAGETKTIEARGIQGVSGKISIGKSF